MNPILKRPRNLILINVILFVLFALVVLGGVYFANTASGQGSTHPTPNLDRLPPEKQTVFARSFPTVNPNIPTAPRVLGTPVLPTSAPGYIPTNLPHRDAGAGTIIDLGQAPLPSAVFAVFNQWYAVNKAKADEKIIAYAGGLWDDPALKTSHPQGFVYVMYKSLDDSRSTRPDVFAKTPSATGALTIVDATGMKLKLQSEKGVIYFFDVTTGQFVSQ